MKKIGLIFVLVLSLMLSLVGCGNDNEKDGQPVKANPVTDFEYKVMENRGDTVITKYIGESKDVVIPHEIEGYPVKYIDWKTFYKSDIESIVLPDTLELIVEGSFSGCDNLHTVDFGSPKKLIIMSEAFLNCSSLKKIILPSGVTEIESKAFYGCESVEEIYIPNTVTKWSGEMAFGDATALKTLTLEEGLKTIGGCAFLGADSLESIILPASIENIEYAAFSSCAVLKSATFLGNAPTKADGVVFGEPNTDFKIYYKKGTAGWDTTSLKNRYILVEYE